MKGLVARLALVSVSTAATLAACSAGNGEVGPSEIRDAAPLEASRFPDLEGGTEDDAGTHGEGDADAADTGAAPVVLLVNEVYVDQGGGGSQSEYVELRGKEGDPLDGFRLRIVHPNGSVNEFAIADPGETMPSSGVWVVGGALLPGSQIADKIITTPEGWGLDDIGAAQLVYGPERTLVDVVGWTDDADAAAIVPPSIPPVVTSEGARVLLPDTASTSIGRKPGAADTNDNAADFCRMAATPRAPNPSTCDP